MIAPAVGLKTEVPRRARPADSAAGTEVICTAWPRRNSGLGAFGRGAESLRCTAEPHAADSHRHCRLGGIDDRDAELVLEDGAILRHSGASHHDYVGAVNVAQRSSAIGHAGACQLLIGKIDDVDIDGQFRREGAGAYWLRRCVEALRCVPSPKRRRREQFGALMLKIRLYRL
jgi:hypothetical protein